MDRVRIPERFELLRELGRGGMGTVYEAMDHARGGRVALKVLHATDPVAIARFKREFRALQDIEHPHLVALGELFCESDQWSFSMDLIEGVDLIEYVRNKDSFSVDDASLDQDTRTLTPATALGDAADAPRSSVRPDIVRHSLRPGALRASLAPSIIRGAVLPPLILHEPTRDRAVSSTKVQRGDGTPFDEARLRHALVQLADGLSALHAAGKIHRDIKPSNIRIREDHELFLLDFGLVVEASSKAQHLTEHENILGTPAYMAPEHASGAETGPAADWYSVGVVLFEALTGRLPFEGNAIQMMLAKQQREAPRASKFTAGIDPDLDQLCAHLLEFDPEKRATAEHVLKLAAGVLPVLPAVRPRITRSSTVAAFVGRDREMKVLEGAFAKTTAGQASAVLLEGESGTGKTCLAQRFLDQLRRESPDSLILAGRCCENETVPFNAWDSAIESLATYWRELPPEDAGALLPTHIAPLTQTFPALRRVPAVNRAAARAAPAIDPSEVRRRAFSALRELFERASQRAPTIIFIDDLQWIDQDSLLLLKDLLREPAAPPLLFLATRRTTPEEHTATRALQDALGGSAIYCPVQPLDEAESLALANALLSDGVPESARAAESIATEAHGHALFITELARTINEAGSRTSGPMSLTEALWGRVRDQSEAVQSLMTVLSISARPLPSAVAARAAGLPADDLPRVQAALRVRHLIRTTRLDGTEWIEAYHDHVRNAVLPHVEPNRQRKAAERIARALEGSQNAAPNLLSEYWRAAGDIERSSVYAKLAGDDAASALAFDRAATFYGQALLRPSLSAEERHHLHVLHGDTLAKAGRGDEAALAYERAQEGAKGVALFELQRKTGEQLLRSGRYLAGIEVTKRGLRRLGLRFPSSALETVLTILVLRLFLAVRGRRHKIRDEREIAAHRLAQIDICNNIASWLLMGDSLRAIVFQLHHYRLALAAGERRRISISFCHEVARAGSFNGGRTRKSVEKLREQIERASAYAKETGEPYDAAVAAISSGIALVSACLPREGVERLEAADWILREKCWGATWEILTSQLWALRGYFFLGEYATLVSHLSSALQESAERREPYGNINLRVGYPHFAWLVRDDLTGASQALTDSLEQGADRSFALEHHYRVLATTNLALYRGDATEALSIVLRGWDLVRKSRLRVLPALRFASSDYRARAHIAIALRNATDRKHHLAEARRWAADVAKTSNAYGPATSTLLQAQIAMVPGESGKAIELLRDALPGLIAQDLGGHVAVAKRALGSLVGGTEGAKLFAEGDAFLTGQGVKSIPALAVCLAPGFARLE